VYSQIIQLFHVIQYHNIFQHMVEGGGGRRKNK